MPVILSARRLGYSDPLDPAPGKGRHSATNPRETRRLRSASVTNSQLLLALSRYTAPPVAITCLLRGEIKGLSAPLPFLSISHPTCMQGWSGKCQACSPLLSPTVQACSLYCRGWGWKCLTPSTPRETAWLGHDLARKEATGKKKTMFLDYPEPHHMLLNDPRGKNQRDALCQVGECPAIPWTNLTELSFIS